MKNLCELVFVTATVRLFMVRSILFFVFMVIAVLTCSTVKAQDKGFGLGIVVGEPTGISGKLWTGHGNAIDGAVAWSFDDENVMYLHGDFHKSYRYKVGRHRLLPYYGIGGRIEVEDKSKVGIRIPLGMDYLLADSPLDFFIEVVPLLDLAPGTDFSINGAIGIRYFFGKRNSD
jgi:hypothetical protein